jgi:hypothetical protein
MVLTKMSRVVTGPKVKGDTYVDGAVYFSIAGEMALRASEEPKPIASEEAPSAEPPNERLREIYQTGRAMLSPVSE